MAKTTGIVSQIAYLQSSKQRILRTASQRGSSMKSVQSKIQDIDEKIELAKREYYEKNPYS